MEKLPINKSKFQFINAKKTVVNGTEQSANISGIYNLAYGQGCLKATDINGDLVFFDASEHIESIAEELFQVRFHQLCDALAIGQSGFISRESIKSIRTVSHDAFDFIVIDGYAEKPICFFASDEYQDLEQLRQSLSKFHSEECNEINLDAYLIDSPVEDAELVTQAD